MLSSAFIAFATAGTAFLPPTGLHRASPAARRAVAHAQFGFGPTPPDLDDEVKYPRGPDGSVLITFQSLDKTGKEMINMALDDRNKARILAGEPKYESLDAMIDAYMAFEGESKGMSRQQCEDEVLRFLQKQYLLSEGGADFKDPQTIVTFGLLALIVLGGGFRVATGEVVLGS